MAPTIQTDPTPLRVDEYGVIRVGDSQVLLDIVIREFNNGAEPEAIVHGFPTLNLADVYGVIAYYLRRRNEIDDYLYARRQEAEKLRRYRGEATQPGQGSAIVHPLLIASESRMVVRYMGSRADIRPADFVSTRIHR